MRWEVLVVVACGGCGRIAFDTRADALDVVDGLPAQVSFGEGDGATFSNVSIDTPLWMFNANENFGAAPGTSFQSDIHVLVRFDVSALPAGTHIESARIDFVIADSGDIVAGQVSARPVGEAWAEGTLDGALGVPNWFNRDVGTPWATAGGTFGSLVGATSVASPGPFSLTIDPAIVQSWVDMPIQNLGLGLLTLLGHAHTSMRESTVAADRPMLVLGLGP